MAESYNQIELIESRTYTTINTHRGLFRYNRLVFGLSLSPGTFQRIMTKLLGDIPNIAIFSGNVIIRTKSEMDHFRTLEAVFQRLIENELKLQKSKCVFFLNEARYLGHIV